MPLSWFQDFRLGRRDVAFKIEFFAETAIFTKSYILDIDWVLNTRRLNMRRAFFSATVYVRFTFGKNKHQITATHRHIQNPVKHLRCRNS